MFSVADVFVQIGVQGVSAVSSALNSVKGWLSALGQSAASAINGMAGTGGVIGNLATALQGLMQFGSGVVQMFQAIPGILSAIAPMASGVAYAIIEVLDVALLGGVKKFRDLMVGIGTTIKNAFITQFGNLSTYLSSVFSSIAAAIGTKLAPLKAWLQSFFSGLIARAGQLANALGIKFGQLVPKIKAAWNAVKATAASAAQATVQAFADQFGPLAALIGTKLAPIKSYFSTLFSAIKVYGQVAAYSIVTNLASALSSLQPLVQGASQAFQGLKSVVVSLGSAIASALGPVATAALTGIQYAINAATTALTVMGNVASATASAINTVFLGPLGVAFNFIRSGISATIGLVQRLGSVLVSAVTTPLRWIKNFIFSTQGMLTALVGTLSAAAVGRYIVDVAADAEQAAVSFEVMLGSADKAREMLRRIQDLADHTPLELPEVRKGAKTLLAMNVAGNDVTETLRRIGDISQGLTIPFNDLVDIYGKIYQKNRLTGDEFRQFGRRGVPIIKELAEQLNISTEAVYKLGSEGKLHFEDFRKVIWKLTDEGGQFFNLLGRMGALLRGRWSTLKDSIRAVAVQIGEAVAPALKKAVNYLIEFADWAKVAIQPYKSQIEAMANYVAARIPPLINTLKSALPAVMEAAQTAFAIVKAVHGVIDAIVTSVTQMLGGTEGVANAFIRVAREIRFAASQYRLFIKYVEAYSKNLWENLKGSGNAFWEGIKQNAIVFFSNVLPQLLLGVSQFIGQLFDNMITRLMQRLPWQLGGLGMGAKNPNLQQVSEGLMGRMNQIRDRVLPELLKMPGMKAFDFKEIFGLNDPEVKKIWELFLGRRKVFFFEQMMGDKLAGWFQKAKDFFAKKGTDLGGAHANVGEDVAKGRGIQFEGLVQYAKSLQQSVSPHEKQMENLAKQQAKDIAAIKNDGIKINNPGDFNQGARFAA